MIGVVFTALHGMQTRSSDENSVCPSVRQMRFVTKWKKERGCQLLLITNRKSHTGFRSVPTSVTLNNLECHNSPYFAFFTKFDRF